MTDKACDEATENEMRRIILSQERVKSIDRLHTRLFGNRIYVDVEIVVDGTNSLSDAHEAAQKVHDVIEHTFNDVKHCMVHVNPL